MSGYAHHLEVRWLHFVSGKRVVGKQMCAITLNGHLYFCMKSHHGVFMPRRFPKRSTFLFIHPKIGTLSAVQIVCAKVCLQHRSNKVQTRKQMQGSFRAYDNMNVYISVFLLGFKKNIYITLFVLLSNDMLH